jgi:hypothetical protein
MSRSLVPLCRDRPLACRDRPLLSRDRPLLSRDRKRAVPLLLPHPDRHRLALLLNNLSNCRGNIITIPQPTRTSVPRPAFAIRPLLTSLAQLPARVRLETSHNLLRLCVRFHHHVDVIRPYMRCEKRPLSMRTNLPYRFQHSPAARLVQHVRSLVHQLALARCTRLIALSQPVSGNVVVPIHGTDFVAVHMRSVARERNQVCHAKLFYTAPLRSRLGKARSFSECVHHNVQHYKHIRGFL